MSAILYLTRYRNSIRSRTLWICVFLLTFSLKYLTVTQPQSQRSFYTKRFKTVRSYKSSLVIQHQMENSKTEWDSANIFECSTDKKYGLIILNRPLYLKHNIFLPLWRKAQVTVTVDGGTQRWIDYLKEHSINVLSGNCKEYVPNLITGDMDSSPLELIERLQVLGAEVIRTPDQNYTDYTKALMQLKIYCLAKNINIDILYVFVETSGRLDHIIANINTLYKAEKILKNIQVIQVASNSLTWILKPGFHKIKIHKILVEQSSWCGLLPFGSTVNHITTTGLKWNINDACMQFGELVSSSNTYDKCTEVTVDTDSTVLWTMGIEPLVESENACAKL